jgi:hypothetical protein
MEYREPPLWEALRNEMAIGFKFFTTLNSKMWERSFVPFYEWPRCLYTQRKSVRACLQAKKHKQAQIKI